MTQKEFEDRTGLKPTNGEFGYIHDVYMQTSMDKDEFCKDFKKHGDSKIIRDIHARAVNFELQSKQQVELTDLLISKSRTHNDTDFRRIAIMLIGEYKVIMKTLEMDLPLWDEDKSFIKQNLKD